MTFCFIVLFSLHFPSMVGNIEISQGVFIIWQITRWHASIAVLVWLLYSRATARYLLQVIAFVCDDLPCWKLIVSELVEIYTNTGSWGLQGGGHLEEKAEVLILKFHGQLPSWLKKGDCSVTSVLLWYGPVHLGNWEKFILTRKFCSFKSLLISKYKGTSAFECHCIYL